MKAAVVFETGKAPVYSEFKDPILSEGEVRVSVTASALTHFTKVRAAGKHVSFRAQPPFVVGIDGVGILDDGRRGYFLFPAAPYGGMAEKTVVRSSQWVDVPEEVDDVTLAAIADPGMAAWVALELRAKLVQGETVLVNGATGTAGTMAVQIAKYLGASKVIATGRNRQSLDRLLSLGADEIIALEDDGKPAEAALRKNFEEGVDVVLDYLWGPSAGRTIEAAASRKITSPLRFIQIGALSEPNITLAATVLRSTAIQIMGSGIGSVALEDIMRVLARLMQAAPVAGFKIATRALPLCRIGEVWSTEDHTPRIVLTLS